MSERSRQQGSILLSVLKVEPIFEEFEGTKPYRTHDPQELLEEHGQAEGMKFTLSRQAVAAKPMLIDESFGGYTTWLSIILGIIIYTVYKT